MSNQEENVEVPLRNLIMMEENININFEIVV